MHNGTGLVVGIDLGGTKIHAAAVDADGRMLADARTKTLPEEGADAVIARMAELVREVAGGRASDVQAICVGVPGGCDPERGVVDKAPNLGWENVPLRPLLSAQAGGAP